MNDPKNIKIFKRLFLYQNISVSIIPIASLEFLIMILHTLMDVDLTTTVLAIMIFFVSIPCIGLILFLSSLLFSIVTKKITFSDWQNYQSDLYFKLVIKLEEFWDKNKWKILIPSFILLIALIVFCVAHLFEIFIFIWIIIMIYGWIMGRN